MVNGKRMVVVPSRIGNAEAVGADRAPPWDSEVLLRTAKRKSYDVKHVVYREGDPADTVFAIRRGLVKLACHSPDGRMRIVRLHGPGALLGLGGLIAPVYEHTAIAVDTVEAWAVPVGSVARLRRDDPELYCALAETWYASLRSADLWITDFSTGAIRARVARLVNFLSDLQHEAGSTVVDLLTCEEMAAILGVTVESVSRTLAEFKRKNLLRALQRNSAKRYERDARALQLAARG